MSISTREYKSFFHAGRAGIRLKNGFKGVHFAHVRLRFAGGRWRSLVLYPGHSRAGQVERLYRAGPGACRLCVSRRGVRRTLALAGAAGTVTPRATTVWLPAGSRMHRPDWLWRRLWVGGALWEENDLVLAELMHGCRQPATLRELRRHQRRMRRGWLGRDLSASSGPAGRCRDARNSA